MGAPSPSSAIAALILSARGAYWLSIISSPSSPTKTPMFPPLPSSMWSPSATSVALICTASKRSWATGGAGRATKAMTVAGTARATSLSIRGTPRNEEGADAPVQWSNPSEAKRGLVASDPRGMSHLPRSGVNQELVQLNHMVPLRSTSGSRRGLPPTAPTEPDLWIAHPALRRTIPQLRDQSSPANRSPDLMELVSLPADVCSLK